jgi:hypothetical protein
MNNNKIEDSKWLRDEIVSYLNEYFEESGVECPGNIESYIQEQLDNILNNDICEDFSFLSLDNRFRNND